MLAKDVRIASPCSVDWRSMTPADGGRFCGDCKKVVRDLSRMREADARALLAEPSKEGLCVRLLHDAHGRVFFADTQRLMPVSLLTRAKRVATAATLALPLAACNLPDAMSAAFSDDPTTTDEELHPLQGGVSADDRYDYPPAAPAADAGPAQASADASAEADDSTADAAAAADAAPDEDAGPYRGPF